MGKKLNVILCAIAHLPSGTSETGFETLYNTEIKPLILALDKYPEINMVFHYSGVILYWIERRHPEFFMLLEDLLSRKQAELLGGGFYEPVFSLLPLSDKIGQIEMLTTYLRKRFGKRPQGCWLPAMAWEQNLVGPLNSCGMSYTLLEEMQFSGAGIKPQTSGIYAPCITEDQGKLVTVFPVAGKIGKELRKGKPLKVLEGLLDKLPSDEYNGIVVIPIAGEALGEPCNATEYEKLFQDFSNAGNRISFTSTAKILKSLKGLKKNYFPGVWSPEDHTGNDTHPRQFLANYPEAGGIYAKMIYVHTLINNQLRGDKTRKRTALEELWKAQDSAIFRLGSPFSPGLLHPPVRNTAYRSLLEAERITREKGKFSSSLSVFDFDLDGEGEYVFQDDKLNCYVKTRGAGIIELDYLPAAWNYLDTLSPETVKLSGGKKRCAFVDWLAPVNTPLSDIGPDSVKKGRFYGEEEYEVFDIDRLRHRIGFRLPPKAGSAWAEIEIQKIWQLKKNSLAVEYGFRNTGTNNVSFMFIPSLDLSFPGIGEKFLKILTTTEAEKEEIAHEESIYSKNIRALEFNDLENEAVISLEINRSFDVKISHIYSGFTGKEEYQFTCVMPILSVSLEGGKTWKTVFSLRISS